MGCTGTSRTALSAARIALLTGVSAAALFAAGGANAQVPGTQPQTFVNGGEYQRDGLDNPRGSLVTPSAIPGVIPVVGQPQVLRNSTTGLPGGAANINANGTAKPGYEWVAATYLNDKSIGIIGSGPNATGQFEGTTGAGAGTGNNFYVLGSNGQPVLGSTVIGIIGGAPPASVMSACGGYIGGGTSATASTSACQAALRATGGAAAAGWTVVQGNATDPALAAPSNQTYVPATQARVFQASNGSASTTSVPGGSVYSSNAGTAGQTTAIGAGGLTTTDIGTKNSSALTPGKLTLTYGANPAAGITLDATVDPTFTVTNGTPAGTTTINNGAVTAGTSLTVGTSAANQTVITGGIATFTNTAAPTVVTIQGNGTGDALRVVGGGIFDGGGATIAGGSATPVQITSTGQVTINNASTGSGTSSALNVKGDITAKNVWATNNVNAGNNVNVGNQLAVTGQSYLNGGATISNNLTVSGPGNGGAPTAIDMGGNRVQDVGTPIFGTDAANKAYVDRGLNKAYEGTAIALAISQPIIGPNQTFAIRAGWGNYESENAFGLSAAGIIGRDWFWNGSTVALDGGVGWGSNNSVAGKAGITLAFGPGYAAAAPLPLK